MRDESRSLDTHFTSRRARRFMRRAKALSPVLMVPAIFALLVLAMNLVEYRPARSARIEAPGPKATVRGPATAPSARIASDDRQAVAGGTHDVPSVSVIEGTLAAGVPQREGDWLDGARGDDALFDTPRADVLDGRWDRGALR